MWRKLKHLAEEENNGVKKQDGKRGNQSGQISHTYLAQPTAISQKKLPVWKERNDSVNKLENEVDTVQTDDSVL